MPISHLTRGVALVALALTVSASAPGSHRPDASPHIVVFKDPACGCCKSWVDRLRQAGFDVVVHDTNDMTGAKNTGHVPQQLRTCHTAFVNGYVIEGHVPPADIARLLAEKPRVAGLAVPGMPAGSPGMEVGGRTDHYDVIAFNRDGSTHTYAQH